MTRQVGSVVILGVDGAGKTTQAKCIAQTLSDTGARVELFTRSAGVRIADSPVTRTERAAAAASAMRESMAVVRGNGLWVSDRFSMCHYAIDRLCPERCELNLRAAFSTLHPPDIVIWLDVSATEARRRIIRRGEDEESVEYLSALAEAYWSLPEASEYIVVNGMAPIEEVHTAIRREIGW